MQFGKERCIVRMLFGSHVYGTNTPDSDHDYKEVFAPRGEDILLGRTKGRNTSTGNPNGKNGAGDVDTEAFTLQAYLKHLCDGQTVATDMLFVPKEFFDFDAGPRMGIWDYIYTEKHRLLSSNVKAALGYCRSQANKYGIKGSRMAAARAARDFFEVSRTSPRIKLQDISNLLDSLSAQREHIEIIEIDQPGDRPPLKHIQVCGKKVPFTETTDQAFEVYDGLFNKYGERTREAERNENVDWKAMMHAVRIGEETIQLLDEGMITFPRQNAEDLLQIRQGMIPYAQVAERLEGLLDDVEVASTKSPLRPEPDWKFAEELILDTYERQI